MKDPAWWPRRIGPSVTAQPASTLDLLPTVLKLAGAPMPEGRVLDGRDLGPVLFQQETLPPQPFFFYRGETLMAVRLRKWKLHYRTQAGYGGPPQVTHEPPILFQLGRDPGERFDVAAENPEVVAQLKAVTAAHMAAIETPPSLLR